MSKIGCPTSLLCLLMRDLSVGTGHVYPNTTNPHVTTGDGMAMAFRAQAQLAGMEFIQVIIQSLNTLPQDPCTELCQHDPSRPERSPA